MISLNKSGVVPTYISSQFENIHTSSTFIYNGESSKPVNRKWQGLIQAHNFYFPDLNKVDLSPQMCMKNIHTSLAVVFHVTC